MSKAPWRIEGKVTPFSPWMVVNRALLRLDDAVRESERIKASRRYYATRIRAN